MLIIVMDTRQMTFADKFGHFKMKFMITFWVILFIVILKSSYPFIVSLYSISHSQNSFYEVIVKDDTVKYSRVSTMPEGWVPLSKIAKRLQGAIISSEDGKFYLHPGYDLEQLQGAIKDAFVLKKKTRGASTITQQLVKNLFLSSDKTYTRKLKELLMAIIIEKYVDKNKILEIYLNIIEYGKGLYGIDKAAHYYFNKKPSELTARESAFLAMLLPSPKKYSKSFKTKILTPFAKRIIDSVLWKMKQGGHITDNEYLQQLDSKFSWEKSSDLGLDTTNPLEKEEEFQDTDN